MEPPPKRFKPSHGIPIGEIVASVPNEMWLEIFKHLDVVSKIRLRRVSRKWDWLLRDRTLQLHTSVIKLDENECRQYSCLEKCRCPDSVIHRYPFDLLLRSLTDHAVWRKVTHLILVGNYDPNASLDELHSGAFPIERSILFKDLMTFIGEQNEPKSLEEGELQEPSTEEFKKLQTLEVRNMAVDVDCFSRSMTKFTELDSDQYLTCTMVVCNSSLVVSCFEKFPMVEFPASNISFRLNENFVSLGEGLFNWELDWRDFADFTGIAPRDVAAYIRRKYRRFAQDPDIDVSELKTKYESLLRGCENCAIRSEVAFLFKETFGEIQPNERYWDLVKDYDFEELDSYTQYALNYYANPRRCFRYLTEEMRERASRTKAKDLIRSEI